MNGVFLITAKDQVNISEHTMPSDMCTENEKLVSSSVVQGSPGFLKPRKKKV